MPSRERLRASGRSTTIWATRAGNAAFTIEPLGETLREPLGEMLRDPLGQMPGGILGEPLCESR